MNIIIKAVSINLKELETLLEKVSEIQTALKKNHPDVVVNVEAEVK